jgi:hypothetical protein
MAPRILMGVSHDLCEQRPPGEDERQPPHRQPFPENEMIRSGVRIPRMRPVELDFATAVITFLANASSNPWRRSMTLTGGCQCGAVRYEVSAEPLQVYVCHCRECRRQSASAFGISVIVPAAAFALTQGRVKTWSRPTDSGGTLECMFCIECGTRIRHFDPRQDTVSIKGGSLDDPVDITSSRHIWTTRKLPGVIIPDGAMQFAGEPT